MIGEFILSWQKFIRGGRGMSVRTGKYFGESMLVGSLVGFVVVGFRHLVIIAHRLLLEGIGQHSSLSRIPSGESLAPILSREELLDAHRWLLVVLPAAGAILGYLLIRAFASVEHARGTDSAIRAYHQRDGYVPFAVVPVKSVASVLTVGCGGSAGYEGPITLVGAACGSTVARLLHLSQRAQRILMAAGLAAGIGALFQAPLAGALFGFEIFYSSSDVEYETLLPSFTASAIAYTIYACFFGWDPIFSMPPDCVYENGLRLLPYFALAIVVAYGARFYISFYRFAETTFSSLKMPAIARVCTGALLTGAIGFFIPDILGTSYNVIQAGFAAGADSLFDQVGPLTAAAFLVIFFAKAVATGCTVGSGGSGGVFAPALVCGGSLGAAVGLFFAHALPANFGIHPAAFALVGMAGFVASAIRIPMTAIVMVAEISGNHTLLVPAMWVCGISFWLNNGWSLYRSQPHYRGASPVHI